MIGFPWTGETSPHLLIELTDCCNIACRGCYKSKVGGARSMERIMDDIEFALRERPIQTVSLAGAEPTLHPELCKVVRHLHERKVRVALLTNGLALDDALLAKLAAAGLDVVMLHVDDGQCRPDLVDRDDPEELEALRVSLVQRIRRHGVDVGVSVTLYPESFDRLPRLVDWIVRTPEVGFAFISHYLTPEELQRGGEEGGQTDNREVMKILRGEFGVEPFAGVAGSGDAWISYFIPVHYREGEVRIETLRAGWADAGLLRLPRLLGGRHMFYCPPSSVTTGVQTMVNLLFRGRLGQAARFLGRLRGSRLVAKRIVFDDGRCDCRRHCPNPTVRDGQFVPVCLADDHCAA